MSPVILTYDNLSLFMICINQCAHVGVCCACITLHVCIGIGTV